MLALPPAPACHTSNPPLMSRLRRKALPVVSPVTCPRFTASVEAVPFARLVIFCEFHEMAAVGGVWLSRVMQFSSPVL